MGCCIINEQKPTHFLGYMKIRRLHGYRAVVRAVEVSVGVFTTPDTISTIENERNGGKPWHAALSEGKIAISDNISVARIMTVQGL